MLYAMCGCINFVPWCYYHSSKVDTQQQKTSGNLIAIVHKSKTFVYVTMNF